jgi:hypothetical protein
MHRLHSVQTVNTVKKAVLMEIHPAVRVITVLWVLSRKSLALLAICVMVQEIRQLLW